jgi:TATA-binding protein-associated factor
MESLHRQVLPFLLRRIKEDVLHDLPPKIIQDYYCDLSDLQAQLYEDFAQSTISKGLAPSALEEGDSGKSKVSKSGKPQVASHTFQALQYLRKLCNHPKLVLTKSHPQYQTVMDDLERRDDSLNKLHHAPKLQALKQLLIDCGIGSGTSKSTDRSSATSEGAVIGGDGIVGQHRVLIFAQLKSMLDIVENDLLKPLMPSVTYLRLDGGVAPGRRHELVSKFNEDPTIDLFLLTTHVGGLGLNLTGADTVIFIEHDWNPMKDLQAMDRVHRIGQKKVVNVYRLITRGTLEEKIMRYVTNKHLCVCTRAHY